MFIDHVCHAMHVDLGKIVELKELNLVKKTKRQKIHAWSDNEFACPWKGKNISLYVTVEIIFIIGLVKRVKIS